MATAWDLFRRQRPSLAPRLRFFERQEARRLILAGSTPFITQASSSVIFAAPIWCLSALFGPAIAGNYYTLFRVTSAQVILCTLLTVPMWPAYARYQALQQTQNGRRLLMTSLALVTGVNLAGMAALLFCFGPIVRLVSGGSVNAPAAPQVVVIGILALVMSLRQAMTMATLGRDRGRTATRAAFLLGVVVSIALPWGRTVFSCPHQVPVAFICLEVLLLGAMCLDSREGARA
jgi:O-antigen/teichoic acid export membrane protein